MEELKSNVAKNIAAHRKKLNLTQLQLAEKLNYSDKAVSKWERGEAVPDVYILHELAEMFGITIDELISAEPPAPPKRERGVNVRNRTIISLLSVGLVWLIATVLYVLLRWAGVKGELWLAFIYALPVSAIVAIVFNAIWGMRPITAVLVSVLIWTLALCVRLTFAETDIWLIFMVGIPLQVLTVLWFLMKKKGKKK